MAVQPSRRTRVAVHATQYFFEGLARAGRRTPLAQPRLHGVELLRDLTYGPRAEQRLDIYRPRGVSAGAPCVVYVHGGAFRSLSKDTHWLFGLGFTRLDAIVFSIDYRLAPRHPYPAAAEDVCTAWLWVLENAERFGGDPTRLAVAGDSAGANLAEALTVATCYRRAEPWARAVFDAGVVPRVSLPACGLFQVSDTDRYARNAWASGMTHRVVAHCEEVYLPTAQDPGLADPVVIVERDAPERPLPPTFLPVGTWDPLQHDTRRMAAALQARGTTAIDRYYPREIHAFHALIWRTRARECWQDMLGFASAHL